MLREIASTRKEGDRTRTWYQGSEMDLFVWRTRLGQIAAFQLSYDKSSSEKLVSWDRDEGFRHEIVDEGHRPGNHPAAPIAYSGGTFERDRVKLEFVGAAAQIDSRVREFVSRRIEEFQLGRPAADTKADPSQSLIYAKAVTVLAIVVLVTALAALAWQLRSGI